MTCLMERTLAVIRSKPRSHETYGPIRIGDAYDRAAKERRLLSHTYGYFPGGEGGLSMGFLLDVFPSMLKNICML